MSLVSYWTSYADLHLTRWHTVITGKSVTAPLYVGVYNSGTATATGCRVVLEVAGQRVLSGPQPVVAASGNMTFSVRYPSSLLAGHRHGYVWAQCTGAVSARAAVTAVSRPAR